MKRLVVAIGERGEIGKDGDMPWKRGLPADLQHFKEVTNQTSVIMGRVTFESILASLGHPLRNRQSIVLSRSAGREDIPGAVTVPSLEAAYDEAKFSDISVIGGAAIYRLALDSADVIEATRVHAEFDADTFFTFDSEQWELTSAENHDVDDKNKYAYTFETYTRTS